MRKQRSKQIAFKVTTKIVIGLVAVFIALTAIVVNVTTRDLVQREEDRLILLATENARIARVFMESMLDKQSVIMNAVLNLNDVEDTQKIKTITGIISDTKIAEEHALSLFYIAEPNAFVADSPQGYSIFAAASGTYSDADMFKYINKNLYNEAKASKMLTIVDPSDKTIDGIQYKVLTVLLPVFNQQNEVVGMVGSNIDTATLNGASYDSGGYESFNTQIICGHQTIITNSLHPDQIGEKFGDVSDSTNTQLILGSAEGTSPLAFLDSNTSGIKSYKAYIPFYIKGSPVVWLSGTSINKAEFDKQIVKQVLFIGLWLTAALVALAALAYIRINKELHPIKKLEEAIRELSKGNLHYKLDFISDDELGSLADSFRESLNILCFYITDIDRAMSSMADGDFDLEPTKPFIGDFQKIEQSITRFITKFSGTITQIRIAAEQVSGGSDQVSDGAQCLSQSTAEQASVVEELLAELTEVSSHLKHNAEHAHNVNRLAEATGGKINTSSKQMNEMLSAIDAISSTSAQISRINKTIEDIAFQTNILALNAAVEAARAGAAGKGFAVVADEVRNLAIKSSEAAKQTNVLIASSVKSVENGVAIATETAKSLAEVVAGAEEITMLIAEISAATSEQSGSIAQINREVDQISSIVQTNSATSEESAAASEELNGQAAMLKTLVSQFKLHDQT